MAGLNEYATSFLVTGSSGQTPYAIDFGARMSQVRIFMDSTGLSFGYSFRSTAASTGATMKALDAPHVFDFNQYVTGMTVFPASSATSTAASGVANIRIHAWG